jgi:hypothetical protein
MPFIVAAVVATGGATAVGAAVASIVGATVSTAVATAIGAGVVSAAVTAAQGGNASQILTSAVVGGISSGIGSAVSGTVSAAAQSAAQSAGYTSISHAFGQVAGGIASGAASSGVAAYMTGQNVGESIKSGALLGGLTSAAVAGYDYLTAPKVDTSVGFAPNTTSPEGGFHTTTDLAQAGLNSGPAGKVPSMYGDFDDGLYTPKGTETNPLLAGQKPGASNVRVLQASGPANQVNTGTARVDALTGKDAVAAVNNQIKNPVYNPTAQVQLDNAYRNALSTTPGVTTPTGAAGTTNTVVGAAPSASSSGSGFLSTAMDKLSDPWVAVPMGLSLLSSSKPQAQDQPSGPQLTPEQQALREQFYEPLPVYTLNRDYTIQPNTVDWDRYGRDEPGTQQFFTDSYYQRAKDGGLMQKYANGGDVKRFASGGDTGDITTRVMKSFFETEIPPGMDVGPFGRIFKKKEPTPTLTPTTSDTSIPTPSSDTIVPSSSVTALGNVIDPSSYLSSRRKAERALASEENVTPYRYEPKNRRGFLTSLLGTPELSEEEYYLLSQRPYGYAKGGEVDSYSDTGRLKRAWGGNAAVMAVNPNVNPRDRGSIFNGFRPENPYATSSPSYDDLTKAVMNIVKANQPEVSQPVVVQPVDNTAQTTNNEAPLTSASSLRNVVDPSSYLTTRRTSQSLVDNQQIDPYKYVPRARSFLSAFRDDPQMFQDEYYLQSQRPYGYAKGGEVDSYSDTGRMKKMVGGITGFVPMITPTQLRAMGQGAMPVTASTMPYHIETGQVNPRVSVGTTSAPTTSNIPTPSPNTVVPSDSLPSSTDTSTALRTSPLRMVDPSSYLTSGRRQDRPLLNNVNIDPYTYKPRQDSILSRIGGESDLEYFLRSQRPYGYAMGGEVNDSGITPANFNQVPGTSQPNYYTYGAMPQRESDSPVMMKNGGLSDGRTDDIPALLSDGEYVIDAETVALLGNGSSEAGSKQLDHMRQQIRKQKGGALSKGQISPDAKSPLAYFKQRMA